MTVGSLLLQCLLAGVIFDSQLVLTAGENKLQSSIIYSNYVKYFCLEVDCFFAEILYIVSNLN